MLEKESAFNSRICIVQHLKVSRMLCSLTRRTLVLWRIVECCTKRKVICWKQQRYLLPLDLTDWAIRRWCIRVMNGLVNPWNYFLRSNSDFISLQCNCKLEFLQASKWCCQGQLNNLYWWSLNVLGLPQGSIDRANIQSSFRKSCYCAHRFRHESEAIGTYSRRSDEVLWCLKSRQSVCCKSTSALPCLKWVFHTYFSHSGFGSSKLSLLKSKLLYENIFSLEWYFCWKESSTVLLL